MPWRECHVMDERIRFVARLLEGEKMAPLCAEFGISRRRATRFLTGTKTAACRPSPTAADTKRRWARKWTFRFWVCSATTGRIGWKVSTPHLTAMVTTPWTIIAVGRRGQGPAPARTVGSDSVMVVAHRDPTHWITGSASTL
jgi:hypothetical protein